jgi:hypothetical protein
MPAPKFIDIDGKRFVGRELLQRRREQLAAAAKNRAAGSVRDDGGFSRPASERRAAGRYSELSLFDLPRGED